MPKEITLEDHAVRWWRRRGRKIPGLTTKRWEKMYLKWVSVAFDFK
jgi:hypothetical protein